MNNTKIEKIKEILKRNTTWASDLELETNAKEIDKYIQENFQLKATSTYIEELEEDAIRSQVRDVLLDVYYAGVGSSFPTDEYCDYIDDVVKIFAPHLSNKSELKKEVVREFVKYVFKQKVGTDPKARIYLDMDGDVPLGLLGLKMIMQTYLSSDEKNSKLGGKE